MKRSPRLEKFFPKEVKVLFQACMTDFAFMESRPGQVLWAEGPFAEAVSPPCGCAAFYVNDFWLSNRAPWRLPAKTEWITTETLAKKLGGFFTRPQWTKPEPDNFRADFSWAQEALAEGRLQKIVLTSVEEGNFDDQVALSERLPGILRALFSLSDLSFRYGFFENDQAFLGASPEWLFQLDSSKRQLRSMALAGTAALSRDAEDFLQDPKEREEHEWVVRDVQKVLSGWGRLRRGPLQVLRWRSLQHLLTPLQLEAFQDLDWRDVLQALHPTPALGGLPRAWALERLRNLPSGQATAAGRRLLGAPFGLAQEDGSFHFLVAIRQARFWQRHVEISTGCGIVGASRLEKEWHELALKRRAVKELFGWN